MSTAVQVHKPKVLRHAGVVRATHWITVAAFLALTVTGGEIVLSHPRFYWGETGNVNMHPLFTLPLPSSRGTVPTGFGYVLPDQNGWSRYLHFEAAWVLLLTGLVYVIWGLLRGHFRSSLLPAPGERNLRAHWQRVLQYLRRGGTAPDESLAYNVLQRTTYLAVVFVLFPLVIWTGLAMSLWFEGTFPWAVELLGGRQSARTLHFFVSWALVLFLVVHVVMVALSGFRRRTRAMITGFADAQEDL